VILFLLLTSILNNAATSLPLQWQRSLPIFISAKPVPKASVVKKCPILLEKNLLQEVLNIYKEKRRAVQVSAFFTACQGS
ncbi:MAG: hypothetical protein P8185_15685, partial [Deltaproteobacteria bacterium]